MSYTTVVREARFRIGDVSQGTCIKMWWRETDAFGVATFTAQCGPDDGEGRCALCWKQGANADAEVILAYACDDVNCLGTTKKKSAGDDQGCVLQYSIDGREFTDVTPEEPPASQNCYFRCLCCPGEARKQAKKSLKKSPKKQSKKPQKKAARKKKK